MLRDPDTREELTPPPYPEREFTAGAIVVPAGAAPASSSAPLTLATLERQAVGPMPASGVRTTIVVLPQVGYDAYLQVSLMEALARQLPECTIVAITPPGHPGSSRAERYTFDAQLDAVTAALKLRRVAGDARTGPVLVVGTSQGASMGLLLAARGDVDAVVAFSPPGCGAPVVPGIAMAARLGAGRPKLAAAMQSWLVDQALKLRPAEREWLRRSWSGGSDAAQAISTMAEETATDPGFLLRAIKRLQNPITDRLWALLISGTQDTVLEWGKHITHRSLAHVYQREVEARLEVSAEEIGPGVQTAVVPGMRHSGGLHMPEECAARVAAFARRVPELRLSAGPSSPTGPGVSGIGD